MKYKLLIFLSAALFMLISIFTVKNKIHSGSSEPKNIIKVENKICPVMGHEIIEEQAIKFEHEGKIYNLCCAECTEILKQDPSKYIKKLNGDLEIYEDSCSKPQSCQG